VWPSELPNAVEETYADNPPGDKRGNHLDATRIVVTYGPRPTLEELERCGYALRSGYQGDAALEAGALHGAGEEASRSSR
jgi:hypothetical protein